MSYLKKDGEFYWWLHFFPCHKDAWLPSDSHRGVWTKKRIRTITPGSLWAGARVFLWEFNKQPFSEFSTHQGSSCWASDMALGSWGTQRWTPRSQAEWIFWARDTDKMKQSRVISTAEAQRGTSGKQRLMNNFSRRLRRLRMACTQCWRLQRLGWHRSPVHIPGNSDSLSLADCIYSLFSALMALGSWIWCGWISISPFTELK